MNSLRYLIPILSLAVLLGAICQSALADSRSTPPRGANTSTTLLVSDVHESFVPPIEQQVVAQARSCLDLPTAAAHGSYKARLNVAFEAGMARDIRVLELDPPGATGRSIVEAAERSLVRCGPFEMVDDGTLTLVFESEE